MKKLKYRRHQYWYCLLFSLLYLQILFKSTTAELCSPNYKMQNLSGHYILGGFVPAHKWKDSAYRLHFRAITWASAILYAVREINKDKDLLPGITLGYDIRDSCQLKPTASRHTLDYILDPMFFKPDIDTRNYDNSSCIKRGNSQSILFGVIGADRSPLSTVVNNLLGVDFIPQVSYGSTSTSLSDPIHRSFIRTVPSDIHQAGAIVDLLKHFDWTYVSAFVEDDEYGRIGLDETRKNIKKQRMCLAGEIVFNANLRRKELRKMTAHLKRMGGKSHVVIIWASRTNALKIMLASQLNKISNITWIGSEAWGTHPDLRSTDVRIRENIIGLEIPSQPTPGFHKSFINGSYELVCGNPWFTELIRIKYQQAMSYCNLTCSGKMTPCQEYLFPVLTSVLVGSKPTPELKTDLVLKSVYALAHGLHKALNCSSKSCPLAKKPLNYKSIYDNTLNSEFILPDTNQRIKFDKYGEILDVSYYYKFFNPRRKVKGFVRFGSWKADGPLIVDEKKIDWGRQMKPVAHCSDDCRAGTYRLNGSSSCCWSCPPCLDGTITDGENQYTCKKCKPFQLSNLNHTYCIDLEKINMKLYEENTILLMALAIFGAISTIFILCVFIKYWNTPIIKSTSREMSCIQLISILLLFIFPAIYIIENSPNMCILQLCLFTFLQSTVLSLILVKTYRLLCVFRERFTNVSKFLHTKYQIAFAFLFVLIITTAVILWFVYFPSAMLHVVDKDNLTYYTRCGNDIIWFIALLYLFVLELVILGMAFRARKLPENFNEVQYIVFTMFTDLIVWLLVSLALYVSFDRLQFTEAFLHVNFTSNYCRIVILYGYRIRIILFYPELNSPEHFRRTATGTTVTNFIRDIRRDDGTYKRSITSVVQLQDYSSDSPTQNMRYSYSSLKQHDVNDGQSSSELNRRSKNDNHKNIFRLAEPTIKQPKTSPVFEINEPFSETDALIGGSNETPESDSDNESTSSTKLLTEPKPFSSSMIFQKDVKRWASSQCILNQCSDDECCKLPRSVSADCLQISLNEDQLEELLNLKETTM